MKIEILGTGCPKCHQTKVNVAAALAELGKDAEVVEVKDLKEIANYGVMITPAVVINSEVKIAGKVPSLDQIKSLIG